MQQVLLIILAVIFGLYILLILYYWKSWLRIPVYKIIPPAAGQKSKSKISVIIPARNEEENITACLDSVCSQSYPKELYEVLVVDDHSTDNTAAIIKNYSGQNVKLISLKDFVSDTLNSYKKKAIEIAIRQSSGELIVTTDADCIVPKNWLQTIAAFYEEQQPEFIAAPVSINCGFRFIEMFQALDFATLQGITGASVYKKMHSMCNGANFAYEKNAFHEVDGFKGIDIIRDISLIELMEKMKDFSYFLGLDSGVSHLAGVLGLKGTAFFHHTNPQYWRPLGNIKPLIVDMHNLLTFKNVQLSILNLS